MHLSVMANNIDLEKFFDRVNHDILMSLLSKEIKDKAVLRIYQKIGCDCKLITKRAQQQIRPSGNFLGFQVTDCVKTTL